MGAKRFYKFLVLTAVVLVAVVGSYLFVQAEVEVEFGNYLPAVFKVPICDVPSAGHPTIQSGVDDFNCEILNLTAVMYIENVTVYSRTVTIQGQGPAATTIDGNASGPVFAVREDAGLNLVDLTVTNGLAEVGGGVMNEGIVSLEGCIVEGNSSMDGPGGGIYTEGDLSIGNSWILDNTASPYSTAGNGGGIFVQKKYQKSAVVQIENTVIRGNAGYEGGGISVEGNDYVPVTPTVTLVNSVVSQNQASFGGGILTSVGTEVMLMDSTVQNNVVGASGGGILNGGEMQILNSHILNNTAGTNMGSFCGGGIHNSGGSYSNSDKGVMYIEWSEIRWNYSGDHGGGICNAGNIAELTILKSLVAGNTAADGNGGGLESTSDIPAYVENSTFANNIANQVGGGISGLYVDLANVTLNNNSALAVGIPFFGGGLFVWQQVNMVNSIVAGNMAGGDCGKIDTGILTSQGHNIDSDGSCQLVGPGDMSNTNPMLGPLQNNGGPTLTCALLLGSPAIDTADNSACPATDQRGVLRPQGAGCDIGAYEYDG